MQITDHIHALKIPFHLTIRPGLTIPRFVYAYLIYGKQEVWLVDTGVAGSEGLIFDYLETTRRRPEEISLVIQTHSHPDHIGATQAIQRATGCSVVAHKNERVWIEDVDLQRRERPVPGFHTLVGGSAKVDRTLVDGEVLRLDDGLTLAVLHTPGHSKGSISLWCPEEKVLICGDAVPLPGSIPIYEDAGESVRSVRKLMDVEGVEVLLSSWDAPHRSPEIQPLLVQSLDYLHRIDEVVLRSLPDGSTPDPLDLCRRVVADLGLPEIAANPLVARTFMANLRSRPLIRPCEDGDFEAICSIINDAAEAYRAVIPRAE